MPLKKQKKLLAFYCGIWAFVFGFRRHDVGNDTPGYAAFFENVRGMGYGTIDNPDESLEGGYLLFSRIINVFTDSSTLVFCLIGIGIWGCAYHLYNKQSHTLLLSFMFMMTITGQMFYTLGIAVRQSLSIIVLIWGINLILKSQVGCWRSILKNKQAMIGLLLCLASITIHRTTGMLVVVLGLMFFLRMTKLRAYVLIALFTCVALFAAPIIGKMFDALMMMIGTFSDDKVNLLGDRYLGDISSYGYSGGAMLAWTIPAFLTTYLTNKDDINSYFFKIYIFAFCLHQFLQFSSMHIRLTPLFILLGFTMSVPKVANYRKIIYNVYLLIGLFYLYIDYRMLKQWDVEADTAVPYFFIWN